MNIRAAVVVVVTLCLGAPALADIPPPVKQPLAQPSKAPVEEAPPAEAPVDVDVDEPVIRPPPPPEPMEALVGMPSAADMLMPFVKTMLMLCVVLALVWLTLHKGMGKLVEKAQAGKRVRVVERISLDARRSLFLVEVDGKQMILAGGDVVRITEIDALGPQLKTERQGLFDKVMSAAGKPPITIAGTPPPKMTTTTTTSTETEQAS
ncbi:MAG: flagellar biosynthetic protein FliO [Deltaproteobacteria bacterium]|nr:flagellar biosynthetic protein FliO [Deltaproteobacteria bacterium]